ncbi:MAG: molybdopterin converting factor subunit 1 [Rhodoferax sp.]
MKVTVRYFASVREAMGTGTEQLDTQATTLAALRAELLERGGAGADALAPGRAVRMALDQVMSPESTPLTAGCEVAFFPPVTGG